MEIFSSWWIKKWKNVKCSKKSLSGQIPTELIFWLSRSWMKIVSHQKPHLKFIILTISTAQDKGHKRWELPWRTHCEMQIWSTEAQRINIIPWVSQTNVVKLCLRRPAGRAREKHSALDTLSLVSNHTDTLVCHLKFNSEIFTPSGTRRCRWRCLYALTESGFLIHLSMKYIWQK